MISFRRRVHLATALSVSLHAAILDYKDTGKTLRLMKKAGESAYDGFQELRLNPRCLFR